MTRIAHCVLSLEVGGLEVLVANLARDAQRHGYKPVIICLDEIGVLGEELSSSGIDVRVLNRKAGFFDYNVFVAIVGILRDCDIDVIHTHNFEAYKYAALARRLTKIKRLVHTQHGLVSGLNSRKRMLIRLLRGAADYICPVSESVAVQLKMLGWIRDNNYASILNGVNVQEFTPNAAVRDEYRRNFDISPEDLVCICVARVAEVKDHETLITGFEAFLVRQENAKLLVVGDGPLFSNIEKLVAQKNLKDKVLLLGERNDVLQLLQMSDVFVMTSKSEGVSIALLEAMSTGIVPVVTEVGGNREVVDSGTNGFLVAVQSPNDLACALRDLQANESLRLGMGDAARARVISQFSLDKTVRAYATVYGENETLGNLIC